MGWNWTTILVLAPSKYKQLAWTELTPWKGPTMESRYPCCVTQYSRCSDHTKPIHRMGTLYQGKALVMSVGCFHGKLPVLNSLIVLVVTLITHKTKTKCSKLSPLKKIDRLMCMCACACVGGWKGRSGGGGGRGMANPKPNIKIPVHRLAK